MGDTKRILLVCSAGMSTSLLMTNMEKSAKARGLNVEIMAKATTAADKYLSKENVDVLLLGPQVRFLKNKYEKLLNTRNIPVAIIDMKDYGTMNGEKVLNTALELMN